jgi:hypothetical protein
MLDPAAAFLNDVAIFMARTVGFPWDSQSAMYYLLSPC